jgi:hypothetical protein
VYDGVRIDYRGADVTAENFLSVLLGDAAAMAGKGSGRVVDSGPHDKVGLSKQCVVNAQQYCRGFRGFRGFSKPAC